VRNIKRGKLVSVTRVEYNDLEYVRKFDTICCGNYKIFVTPILHGTLCRNFRRFAVGVIATISYNTKYFCQSPETIYGVERATTRGAVKGRLPASCGFALTKR